MKPWSSHFSLLDLEKEQHTGGTCAHRKDGLPILTPTPAGYQLRQLNGKGRVQLYALALAQQVTILIYNIYMDGQGQTTTRRQHKGPTHSWKPSSVICRTNHRGPCLLWETSMATQTHSQHSHSSRVNGSCSTWGSRHINGDNPDQLTHARQRMQRSPHGETTSLLTP